MRNPRPRPELLPEKLLAIREFLNIGQDDMADQLRVVLSHSGREYQILPGRISEYENGKREPNLLVLNAYARLGKLHMESVADDDLIIDTFRKRLGQEFDYSTLSRPKRSTSQKKDKPVTLISGTPLKKRK